MRMAWYLWALGKDFNFRSVCTNLLLLVFPRRDERRLVLMDFLRRDVRLRCLGLTDFLRRDVFRFGMTLTNSILEYTQSLQLALA